MIMMQSPESIAQMAELVYLGRHIQAGTIPLYFTNSPLRLRRRGDAPTHSGDDEHDAHHLHNPPEHTLMMCHVLFPCAHLRARLRTRRPVVPRRAPDMRARERVGLLRSLVVSPGRRPRVFARPGWWSVRVVVLPGVGRAAPPADVVGPVRGGVVVPVCVCTRGHTSALRHCAVVCSSAVRLGGRGPLGIGGMRTVYGHLLARRTPRSRHGTSPSHLAPD